MPEGTRQLPAPVDAAWRALAEGLGARLAPAGLIPVEGPAAALAPLRGALMRWAERTLPAALAVGDAPEADRVVALGALGGWILAQVGPFGAAPPQPGARRVERSARVVLRWPGDPERMLVLGGAPDRGLRVVARAGTELHLGFAPQGSLSALARELAAEHPDRSPSAWEGALHAAVAGAAGAWCAPRGERAVWMASLGVQAAALSPETRAPGELLRLGAGVVQVLVEAWAPLWEAMGQGRPGPERWLLSLGLLPGELRAQAAAHPALRAECGGEPDPGVVVDSRWLPAAAAPVLEALAARRPPDGWLVHGDGLGVLGALPLPPVQAAIFDPPYNTGQRLFRYADRRDPAAWGGWVAERAARAWALVQEGGALAAFIDPAGLGPLRAALDPALGGPPAATVAWQKVYTVKNSARGLSGGWDAVLVYGRGALPPLRLPFGPAEARVYQNPDGDPRGPWISSALQARNPYAAGRYALRTPGGREVPGPPAGTWWRLSEARLGALHAEGRVWWGRDGRALPRVKRYLAERAAGRVVSDWWPHDEVGSNAEARAEARALLGEAAQGLTPKPTRVLMRLIQLLAPQPGAWVLDHFAGSGTLGQAALRLRREQGQGPRVVLVEAGAAFEEALLPGLRRLARSSRWVGGRPAAEDAVEVLYRVQRVSGWAEEPGEDAG